MKECPKKTCASEKAVLIAKLEALQLQLCAQTGDSGSSSVDVTVVNSEGTEITQQTVSPGNATISLHDWEVEVIIGGVSQGVQMIPAYSTDPIQIVYQ